MTRVKSETKKHAWTNIFHRLDEAVQAVLDMDKLVSVLAGFSKLPNNLALSTESSAILKQLGYTNVDLIPYLEITWLTLKIVAKFARTLINNQRLCRNNTPSARRAH